MRALPAVAVALFVGLSAPADMAGQPVPEAVAAVDFRQASSDFEQKMRDLVAELADPANQDRTHIIVADYQDDADAFADLIEARRSAGLSTPGNFNRAAKVREMPRELRLATAQRMRTARFAEPRDIPPSPFGARHTGLITQPRVNRF